MSGNARTNRTAQRVRDAFLAELAQRGIVSDAAKAAGAARRSVYEWRDADPAFRAAWDDALDQAVDTMEREAYRRAVEGIAEPVVGRVARDQDGILTGEDGRPLYIRKYSDSLLTTILKAHRPEKYRERADVQHSGVIQFEFVNNWRTAED